MISQTQIENIFAECFAPERTILIGGADEPLYQPHACFPDQTARIYYRSDYVSSALHEISHWCIAGRARRELVDFGYWYRPDGRGEAEQQEFFQFEAKPQALESIFAEACQVPFHLSADNLGGTSGDLTVFAAAVAEQRKRFLGGEMPPRARRLLQALMTITKR